MQRVLFTEKHWKERERGREVCVCVFFVWDDWRKIAQDRGAWRCLVMEAASDANEHKEAHEKEKKDERKKR